MFRLILLSLLALPIFAQITTQITKADQTQATIAHIDVPVGASGIVVHRFDQDHSTIVARAIYEGGDIIRFTVYDALAQESLPTPKIRPQKGDEVILEYLYDRSTLIAPNLETYQRYVAQHPDIQWLHPDLFATELSKAHHPAPSREDFKNYCNKFALGAIHIALKNEVAQVDCYSFKTISKEPFEIEVKSVKLPFYSRLKEIEGSLFDFFGQKEIENYFSYYRNLVEGR